MLSDDKIYEMLSNQDLNRFVRSSKRIKSICQPILDKRYQELSEEDKSNILVDKLKRIIQKLYIGDNLTSDDIKFASKYIIDLEVISSYIENELESKIIELNPETVKRYEDILEMMLRRYENPFGRY